MEETGHPDRPGMGRQTGRKLPGERPGFITIWVWSLRQGSGRWTMLRRHRRRMNHRVPLQYHQPLRAPTTIRSPGARATACTAASTLTVIFSPPFAPHTRTVASPPPETITGRPSSSPTATDPTSPSWPRSGSPTGWPEARSHTRTLASRPPETITGRPSSSPTATDPTSSVVAPQRFAQLVPARGAGPTPAPSRPSPRRRSPGGHPARSPPPM